MASKKMGNPESSVLSIRDCKGPPSTADKIINPKQTLFSMRNFKRAVNFHSEEKLPCKNTWYRDVKSTHVRNKRLLDLPYSSPKCCTDIYNISVDRQKLKKLKKYNLTRPVRSIIPCGSDIPPVDVCTPEPTPVKSHVPEAHAVIFPECYILPESESDSDSEMIAYEYCKSGSVSECSMCSNKPDCGTRKKIHRVMKSDWRDLLHAREVEFCKDMINEEISKHKLGMNFKLKLKKVF